MSDSQIIKNIEEFLGLSTNALSKALELKNAQTLYDIHNGKHGISKELAERISVKYLNISKSWLLTGEGEMLKEKESHDNTEILNKGYYIPLLPISAQGGSLNDFTEGIDLRFCERVVSPIKGMDYVMSVSGDSMAPEYPSGCQVLIKKINERAFIDWGRVYVLDTCNGSVIKKIMPGEDKEHIMCVSINTEYPPYEIAFEDMFGMYRVHGLISLK